jgi:hypothetical protein
MGHGADGKANSRMADCRCWRKKSTSRSSRGRSRDISAFGRSACRGIFGRATLALTIYFNHNWLGVDLRILTFSPFIIAI